MTPRPDENTFIPPEYVERLEQAGIPDPPPVHFMTHTHTQNGITSSFTCTADETAPCHWYPDAEEWTEGDGQERLPHTECWIGPWMDNGCAETCGPENGPVQAHAPIGVELNGCLVWSYTDPAPACTCPRVHEPSLGPEPDRFPSPDCPYPQHHPKGTAA